MPRTPDARRALTFVLLVGVMSLFADFAYEGARGIAGPYLALLGASGTAVGMASGLGELVGYGLRLVSGRLADRTRRFWTLTIFGYLLQMSVIPLLAFTRTWPQAAALLVVERLGKATRNPPRDVMLSQAGKQMGGYGWAFGLHEALDQTGAMLGPLTMAAILAAHRGYALAFGSLAIPAAITLAILVAARLAFPSTDAFEAPRASTDAPDGPLPRAFWLYLAAAACSSAGLADFALMAFHFQRTGALSPTWIPIDYAISMAAGGVAALVAGRLFDRRGLIVLLPVTVAAAAYGPLAFLGSGWMILVGVALWGATLGAYESVIGAAVAQMVGPDRRASAYGLFTAIFGVAWFLGSALLGVLYDRSPAAPAVASVVLELAAVPLLWAAAAALRRPGQSA